MRKFTCTIDATNLSVVQTYLKRIGELMKSGVTTAKIAGEAGNTA